MARKSRHTDESPSLSAVEESLVAEKYAHKLIRTLRVRLADEPGKLAEVASAIGAEGALVGDIERVAIDSHSIVRNITVYVHDLPHLERMLRQLGALPGITVEAVTDNVLEIHEGGKLHVVAIPEIKTLRDLQMIYTPGVASVCAAIVEDPAALRRYTWAGNTVAIVTDGSAVLGLGNIGPKAALPVMEGKAVILHRLAGVGCVPILLGAGDAETIIRTVENISAGFGAIMLEDIAAPKCFEIEARLAKSLSIPVFHDDQHGTAVVVLAALITACQKTGVRLEEQRLVILGSGAAGGGTARLLLKAGVKDIVCCDRAGALYRGRTAHMDPFKSELAELTNPRQVRGSFAEALKGATTLIGVSSAGLVSREMVESMAAPRIVLALANPDPEIAPRDALAAGSAVALDGRTANNALVFPGLIRGALDSGARSITTQMKLAAAKAIAALTPQGMLLPSILETDVHRAVAHAVRDAWQETDST